MRDGLEHLMATKRMLVDGIHPEETRIVVTNGNRLEEFDFESQSRRQLRGNIYLAKVTRVEPSLQAAFVEYGGNRHGFLAFSEIHPDYYQIPVADREALMREEEEDEHASADAEPIESVSEPIDGAAADETEQTEGAPTEAEAEADPQSIVPDDEDSEESEETSHVRASTSWTDSACVIAFRMTWARAACPAAAPARRPRGPGGSACR
jgi:ribonuclease E